MESKGTVLGFDLDDTVYIPAARAMGLFNIDGLIEIDVMYDKRADVDSVVDGIRSVMTARHGRDDVTITTQQQMLDVLGGVLNVLTFAVAAIGSVSLLVGAIGIVTIMTIAVNERTNEIGLLRALGARKSQVMSLFLGEAIVLAAAGGAAGLALGLGLGMIISVAVPALPVQPALLYIVLAEAHCRDHRRPGRRAPGAPGRTPRSRRGAARRVTAVRTGPCASRLPPCTSDPGVLQCRSPDPGASASMIDLRSDTVTQPTPAMREAMYRAETGDDVYREDPTVNALEQLAAEMTGKAAAVFAPSGTQSNLIALLSHCQRGHEYIVGQTGHTYLYEGGGAAVLGGIQPNPLPFADDGTLPLDAVEATIKPDDPHFAMTRLICLENTQAGKVLPMDYLARYSELALRYGLKRHLDGARVFNAAVALEVPVADICRYFDTVSICLSKGLGCPVGSVLVGDEETIARARRWRKMVGGGMRQAGILAAAGIYALENQVARLAEDHAKAARVAGALAALPAFELREAPQTNMVMLSDRMDLEPLKAHLAGHGVLISSQRWVFHLDISDADIDRLISVCDRYQPA